MGKQWTPPSTDTPVDNSTSQWTPPSTDQPVKKKSQASGSGVDYIQSLSGNGLDPSQSFQNNTGLENRYQFLSPDARTEQLQRDYQAVQKKEQDKKILSDRLSQIKSYLNPQTAKEVDKAIDIATQQEPDNLREVSKEEQQHAAFFNSPVGQVLGTLNYMGSKVGKGAVQILKGAGHYAQYLTPQNSTIRDAQELLANKGLDDISDNYLNMGLSKGEQQSLSENKISGSLGGLAEFGAAAAAPESAGATFFLQGAGQAQEQLQEAEKQSGVEVNPLVKEAFIGGTGIANKFLMHDLAGIFNKLPAGVRGDINASISANAIKELSGKEITGEQFNNTLKKGATDFADKFYQLGSDYIYNTAKAGTDLAGLSTANFLMKKGVDEASDKPVFNETAADLAQNISDIVLKDAPVFGSFGTVQNISKLTPYSNYKNSVIESLTHNPSEENVNQVKTDLTNYNKTREGTPAEWTPEELNSTLQNVDQIARIVRSLPRGLSPGKTADAVDLINGRDDLTKMLNDKQQERALLDPSLANSPTPGEEMIVNKIDQANDKLNSIALGKDVQYVDNGNGSFKKIMPNGQAIEISPSRYQLEQNETEANYTPEQRRDIQLKKDIELHKENLSAQISDLSNQVILVDQQAAATGPDDFASQAEAVSKKNRLVTERTKLNLELQNIAAAQDNVQAAKAIVTDINSRRANELSKITIPHTVIENPESGTFDVLNNGDIISQHATPEEAGQTAHDLNAPHTAAIAEINNRYDKIIQPFQSIVPEPSEAQQPPVEPPLSNGEVKTQIGKLKIVPVSDTELDITDAKGETQRYSVEDALDFGLIKKSDLEQIAKQYAEQKTIPDAAANNGKEAESNGNQSVQNGDQAAGIPSETTPAGGAEQANDQSAANAPAGKEAQVVSKIDYGKIKDEADLKAKLFKEVPYFNAFPGSDSIKSIMDQLQGFIDDLKNTSHTSALKEKTDAFEAASKIINDHINSKNSDKSLADKVRSLEIKSKGLQSNILGVPVAIWNAGIKTAAAAIEAGVKISEAIKSAVKYIRDNHQGKFEEKEVENEIRNQILQKPTPNEGEGFHDYAKRVIQWKKDLSSNESLDAAYKREASKAAAPETNFNSKVKKGVDVLRKNIATDIESFNKEIGAKEGSTEHYIAAIKELINGNSIKKVNAERILDSLREKDPKKVVATEASLLKRSLREREQAAGKGYREAKAETRQAFLEYDAAKKTENKQKIADLKTKYEDSLEKEKQARIDQKAEIKRVHNTIRSDIRDILSGLNKSRLLAGVKYNDRDIISFANRLNNVVTEKGIDKFREFVNKAIDNADHGRDINDIKAGIRSAKGLLDKEYVPQNIKSIIRDITSISPERAADPKQFKAILDDINKSQTAQEFASVPQSDMVDFVNKERDNDLTNRKGDILLEHNDITQNNDKYDAQAASGNTNLIHSNTLRDVVNSIIKDDKTTYNEKVKKLNQVDDALSAYKKSLDESVDENGNINNPPADFLTLLDNIKNQVSEPSESRRDALENDMIAKQDQIDSDNEDLSPEQKTSLEILKQVPLAGQDANTLRLFNNILENVTNNDDHSGMTIMEAKAIGNGAEGALKPVSYIDEIGRAPRSVKGANKVLEAVRTVRSVGENISALLTRFANNDFKFLTSMNTGTHFDQIQNGLARVDHEFQEKVAKKIEKLFKQYPDIARNPEAIQRLSLFSYLNQHREFASPDQINKELQKRVATINKDIVLKEGGLDAEKGEAAIERGIWDAWGQKIQEATGVDVHDAQSLKNLAFDDLSKIEFLNEGERAVYDTYREADDSLRPEHEKITNGINKPYETWANHMRDGYRFLGSGLVDVLGTDGLGFEASDNAIDSASDSTEQRVKGDPLAKKSAEKQKVLNLNFFNVQDQGIKNTLYDIHTLRDRMIFDEAMKNKQLQDAIGNENHKFYKEAVKNYVLTDMGLGKGTGEKELKVLKNGLNAITKIGTYKQLLSLTAYVKQATATVVNTLAYTGFDAKLMYQVNQEMGTEAMNELIEKHPISRRAENQANLNVLSDKGISDVNNIVGSPEKGIVGHTADAVGDFINKYFLHLEKNGTTKEPWISKPIKIGDVKTAEWSWATLYADYLLKNGKAKTFEDIDWQKEAANPDREAAAYAEQITSKQLNENTKAGRSKLINDKGIGYAAAKAVLFPFGSFNMHKYQTLVENMRTLTSKDTYVNKESFQNQGVEAMKSLMSNFVEESAFQGLKIGIGLSLTPMLKAGLVYALGSMFGTKEETQKYLDQIDKAKDKKADNALQSWLGQTIGNQFFGGLGNTPQKYVEQSVNWAAKKAGAKDDLFLEPKLSIDQELDQATQAGMISSAFSGNLDRGKDLYRIIDNKDKYDVPVDITPMQKSIIATSILSDVLAMAGLNDADLNRSIDNLRKSVDNDLSIKFRDPYYRDQNEARPISITGRNVLLSPEHQEYYEQQKAEFKKALTGRGIPDKIAGELAAERAKLKLIQKFSRANILGEGTEIKKKK